MLAKVSVGKCPTWKSGRKKRDNDQDDRYTFPPKRLSYPIYLSIYLSILSFWPTKRLGSAADARVVIFKQLRYVLLQG